MSDTVCERCPVGHFSASDSSTEPCQPHRNCSNLGFKTLRWGTSTTDSLCATQDKAAMLECSHHHTLCHNGEMFRTPQGSVGEAPECNLACIRWCFPTKTPIVNSFVSVTKRILSVVSLRRGGFPRSGPPSRFHSFPSSCVFEHQHRAWGVKAMFQALLS